MGNPPTETIKPQGARSPRPDDWAIRREKKSGWGLIQIMHRGPPA